MDSIEGTGLPVQPQQQPQIPRKWSEIEQESGIYALDPQERIGLFDKWAKDAQNYQLKSGGFDNPENFQKFKIKEIQTRRRLLSPMGDDPDPAVVQQDYQTYIDMIGQEQKRQAAKKPDEKAYQEVLDGKRNAAFVGGQMIFNPKVTRDPALYRQALAETDAPDDIKIIYAGRREDEDKRSAITRRDQLAAKIITPKVAGDIVSAVQEGKEILGFDVRSAQDVGIKKDANGIWSVVDPNYVDWDKGIIGGVMTKALPASRAQYKPLKELNEFQQKYGLSDEEMKADYMEALKRSAPTSVSRWVTDADSLEDYVPVLSSKVRVLDPDIKPRVFVPNADLAFDKEAYDAVVDKAKAPEEAKTLAKESRNQVAKSIALPTYNLLVNNRTDFLPYAEKVKTPEDMVNAVSKYYKDKTDQAWYEDIGELLGQAGGGIGIGVQRFWNLRNVIPAMFGDVEAAENAAAIDRDLADRSRVQVMVGGRMGVPTAFKLTRDIAAITPDLVAQLALSFATGGIATAARVSALGATTGLKYGAARTALGAAMANAERGAVRTAIEKIPGIAASSVDDVTNAAINTAKEMVSKNPLKGGAGTQQLVSGASAGLSSMSSTFSQVYSSLRDEGMAPEQALDKARNSAAVAAAITGFITYGFSAAGRGSAEDAVTMARQQVGNFTVRDLKNAGIAELMTSEYGRQAIRKTAAGILRKTSDEALEESLDQFAGGLAQYITNPSKEAQDKSMSEIIQESLYAGLLGSIVGGGIASLESATQATGYRTAAQVESEMAGLAGVPPAPAAAPAAPAPAPVAPAAAPTTSAPVATTPAAAPAPAATVVPPAPTVTTSSPPVTPAAPPAATPPAPPLAPPPPAPTFRQLAGTSVLVDNEAGSIKIDDDGTVLFDRGPNTPPIILSRNQDELVSSSEFNVRTAFPVELTPSAPTSVRDDGTIITTSTGTKGAVSVVTDFVSEGETAEGNLFVTVRDRETGSEFELHGDDALVVAIARRNRQQDNELDAAITAATPPQLLDFNRVLARLLADKQNLLDVSNDESGQVFSQEKIDAAFEELASINTAIQNENLPADIRERLTQTIDNALNELAGRRSQSQSGAAAASAGTEAAAGAPSGGGAAQTGNVPPSQPAGAAGGVRTAVENATAVAESLAQNPDTSITAAALQQVANQTQTAPVAPAPVTPAPAQAPAAPAAVETPVAPKGLQGSQFESSMPKGKERVTGQYEIIEADDLVTSFDPGFPKELQPRDRTRAASKEQIAEISINLDPERLGESPTVDVGAPNVDENGVVLSGNGRVTALRANYESGGTEYKNWISQNAERFGFDPAEVAGMKNPVLVRKITDYGRLSKEEFAVQANQSQVLTMSKGEKAKADASILLSNTDLFSKFRPSEDGNVLVSTNREFISEFVKETNATDLLASDGSWTPDLGVRIQNAVLATMLGGDDIIIQNLIEDPSGYGLKKVSAALSLNAPNLVKLFGTDYSINQPITQAIKDFISVKNSGQNVEEFLDQSMLFADPERTAVSDMLLTKIYNAKSQKELNEFFSGYASSAENAVEDQRSGGLFGDQPRTVQQIVSDLTANEKQPAAEQQDLSFGKPKATPAKPAAGQRQATEAPAPTPEVTPAPPAQAAAPPATPAAPAAEPKVVEAPVTEKKERRLAKDQMMVSVAPRTDIPDRVPASLKGKMYEIQIAGANAVIDSMEKNGAALNGDGTGVGKTRQIIAVAKYYADKGKVVFIISKNDALGKPFEGTGPYELGGSMQKDSVDMGVNLTLFGHKEEKAKPGNIYITNYDRIKTDDVPDDAVVIFDEAHEMVNIYGENPGEKPTSQWAMKLRPIIAKSSSVAYYTATSGDKPHQFAYLHKILGFPTADDYFVAMIGNGVDVKKNRITSSKVKYSIPQGKGGNQFNEWINGLMLKAGTEGRFVKREISYDGTSIQFQDIKGTSEENPWSKYYTDSIEKMDEKTGEGWRILSPDDVKKFSSELTKIGTAIEILENELKNNRKVVMFFSRINEFVVKAIKTVNIPGGTDTVPGDLFTLPSPVDLVKEELKKRGIKFTELHGQSPTKASEAQRQFQEGDINVMLASVESGGTGINLDDTKGTEPRSMIFMFAPYRGVSTIQALGRVWRSTTIQNDNNPTRFIFLTATDINADNIRSTVLAKKLQVMNATVGGTAVSMMPLSRIGFTASMLVGSTLNDDQMLAQLEDPKQKKPSKPTKTSKAPPVNKPAVSDNGSPDPRKSDDLSVSSVTRQAYTPGEARKIGVTRIAAELGISSGGMEAISTVLGRIARTGRRRHKKVAADLINVLQGTGVQIQLVSVDPIKNGWYDPATNTVFINLDGPHEMGVVETILHELVHAGTELAIRNPVTDAQKRLVESLQKQMDDARKAAESLIRKKLGSNVDMSNWGRLVDQARMLNDYDFFDVVYALSSLSEFAAHATTSKAFQQFLSTVEKGGKQMGLFSRFVSAVARFFTGKTDFATDVYRDIISLVGTGDKGSVRRPNYDAAALNEYIGMPAREQASTARSTIENVLSLYAPAVRVTPEATITDPMFYDGVSLLTNESLMEDMDEDDIRSAAQRAAVAYNTASEDPLTSQVIQKPGFLLPSSLPDQYRMSVARGLMNAATYASDNGIYPLAFELGTEADSFGATGIMYNQMVESQARGVTPEIDALYADLERRAKAGDKEAEEEAQRILDEVAKAAGYTIKGWNQGPRPIRGNVIETPFFYLTESQNPIWGEGEGYDPHDAWYLKPGKIQWSDEGSGAFINYKQEPLYYKDGKWTELAYQDDVVSVYNQAIDEYEEAKSLGYDTIAEPSEVDGPDDWGSFQYITFDPERLKTATPFTYDNNGNLIPLSQRFQSESLDIRYSTARGYVRIPGEKVIIRAGTGVFAKLRGRGMLTPEAFEATLVTDQEKQAGKETARFLSNNLLKAIETTFGKRTQDTKNYRVFVMDSSGNVTHTQPFPSEKAAEDFAVKNKYATYMVRTPEELINLALGSNETSLTAAQEQKLDEKEDNMTKAIKNRIARKIDQMINTMEEYRADAMKAGAPQSRFDEIANEEKMFRKTIALEQARLEERKRKKAAELEERMLQSNRIKFSKLQDTARAYLPEKLVEEINNARDAIDGRSEEIKGIEYLMKDGRLRAVFDATSGMYVTRSYEAFESKNRQDYVEWLLQAYIANIQQPETPDGKPIKYDPLALERIMPLVNVLTDRIIDKRADDIIAAADQRMVDDVWSELVGKKFYKFIEQEAVKEGAKAELIRRRTRNKSLFITSLAQYLASDIAALRKFDRIGAAASLSAKPKRKELMRAGRKIANEVYKDAENYLDLLDESGLQYNKALMYRLPTKDEALTTARQQYTMAKMALVKGKPDPAGVKWRTITGGELTDSFNKALNVDFMNHIQHMVNAPGGKTTSASDVESWKRLNDNILKRRKNIPDYMRKLWGEIDNPVNRVTQTIVKQSTLLANAKFRETISEIGKIQGWAIDVKEYEENPAIYYGWRRLVTGDEGYENNPIAGLYVHPEIYNSLDIRTRPNDPSNGAFRFIGAWVGMALWNATSGLLRGATRNLASLPAWALNSGVMLANPVEMGRFLSNLGIAAKTISEHLATVPKVQGGAEGDPNSIKFVKNSWAWLLQSYGFTGPGSFLSKAAGSGANAAAKFFGRLEETGDSKAYQDLYIRAVREGVADNNLERNDMARLLNFEDELTRRPITESRLARMFPSWMRVADMEDAMGYIIKTGKATMGNRTEYYSSMDSMTKITLWLTEMEAQARIYAKDEAEFNSWRGANGMLQNLPAEYQTKAAQNVNNTVQSDSRVIEGVVQFRKAGWGKIMSPFLASRVEFIRTAANAYALAYREISNPVNAKERAHGFKRLAAALVGHTTYAAIAKMLAVAVMTAVGGGDEDDEEGKTLTGEELEGLRKMLPSWAENKVLAARVYKNGDIDWADVSFQLPFGWINEIFISASKGIDKADTENLIAETVAVQIATDFLGNFTSRQIAIEAISNAMSGYDRIRNKEIWEKDDNLAVKIQKGVEYYFKSAGYPGDVRDAIKMYKAANGIEENGSKYKMDAVILSMATGQSIRTQKISEMFLSEMRQAQDHYRVVNRSLYNSALRDSNDVDRESVIEDTLMAQRRFREITRDLNQTYAAAVELLKAGGMSNSEAKKQINGVMRSQDVKLSQPLERAIMNNAIPTWRASDITEAKMRALQNKYDDGRFKYYLEALKL